MTAFGASPSLPDVPARVGLLNPEQALDLCHVDYSSCPFPDLGFSRYRAGLAWFLGVRTASTCRDTVQRHERIAR